jgi:hypothetical protein
LLYFIAIFIHPCLQNLYRTHSYNVDWWMDWLNEWMNDWLIDCNWVQDLMVPMHLGLHINIEVPRAWSQYFQITSQKIVSWSLAFPEF